MSSTIFCASTIVEAFVAAELALRAMLIVAADCSSTASATVSAIFAISATMPPALAISSTERRVVPWIIWMWRPISSVAFDVCVASACSRCR